MCKEFEEKLRKSFGGQVRVNPEGDIEDGEMFVRRMRNLHEVAIFRKDPGGFSELCTFLFIEDWQKWDELIDLIKSAVRFYREVE